MPGGGGKGEKGGTEVTSTAPEWLNDLGEWSAGKFREHLGKQERFTPYPDQKSPYGEYKSLFSNETGKNYLDSFSAAPRAAYEQSLTDAKNMFGARGTYGSVGNGMMSGAMASAGQNYAASMADAQQKAQAAQLQDYQTSALAQNWRNENAVNRVNYENTMRQQILSNLLGSMGISVPSIVQSSVVTQDSGDSGKGGLGQLVGGGAMLAGSMMKSSRRYKENMRPAENVLDKVISLPVERWRYKVGYGDRTEHLGPYAEDWAERFGGSGREISVTDAVGVLLKAMQEQAARVAQLEQESLRQPASSASMLTPWASLKVPVPVMAW